MPPRWLDRGERFVMSSHLRQPRHQECLLRLRELQIEVPAIRKPGQTLAWSGRGRGSFRHDAEGHLPARGRLTPTRAIRQTQTFSSRRRSISARFDSWAGLQCHIAGILANPTYSSLKVCARRSSAPSRLRSPTVPSWTFSRTGVALPNGRNVTSWP